jgi:hypothetical protein
MKVKTSELTGAALDYTVAAVEGRTLKRNPMGPQSGHGWWIWEATPSGRGGIDLSKSVYLSIGKQYSPSTNWSQGGPIIKREHISLASPSSQLTMFWVAESTAIRKHTQWDHDPLIAAMCCYVASKLGDEVEVPDELS